MAQPVTFDFWYQPVFQDADGTLFCNGCTGPTIATSLWDKVFFNMKPTPGIAEVEVKRERKVDVKDAAGADGATTTIHGVSPAEITVRLMIWTPEQYKVLRSQWPRLMTPPYKTVKKVKTLAPVFVSTFGPGSADTTTVNISGGRVVSSQTIPQALTSSTKVTVKARQAVTFDVSHPKFADMHIKAVQIIGGWGPDIAPIPGARIFTIKAIEYLPKGTTVATQTDVAPLGSLYDPNPYQTPDQNVANLGPR
jgi:hypothetical protein